jgi:hypothetical protein
MGAGQKRRARQDRDHHYVPRGCLGCRGLSAKEAATSITQDNGGRGSVSLSIK